MARNLRYPLYNFAEARKRGEIKSEMAKKIKKSLLTPEELNQLVARLRAGDRTVAHLIIESELKVAYKIAKYYSRWYPNKRDDIVGAAYMGITWAVNRACAGHMYDNNIVPYIAKTVHRFIKEHLERDHLIRIPRDAFRKMIEEHGEIQFVPIAFPLHVANDNDEENQADEDTIEPAAREDTDPIDYAEMFDQLALSNFEKQVLHLKSERRTLHEIGEIVGKSHVWVYKTLENIRERADKLRRRYSDG